MALSSVSVVGNSLRLFRYGRTPPGTTAQRSSPGSIVARGGYEGAGDDALDQQSEADRGPRVALGRAPDRQREAPAGPQHAARLGERRVGVGHQHVPEPAEHAVDRVATELDALGVHHPVVHIPEPELGAAAAGYLHHRRGEVGRDQPAALAGHRGRFEAGVARAGRELEHRVAGPRCELLEHPLAHRGRDLLDAGSPALPARGDRLRDLVDLPALLLDRLRGHLVLLRQVRLGTNVKTCRALCGALPERLAAVQWQGRRGRPR